MLIFRGEVIYVLYECKSYHNWIISNKNSVLDFFWNLINDLMILNEPNTVLIFSTDFSKFLN